VIRTCWPEGGIPGGEIWDQGSIGKGQVKSCRAMIGGERDPSDTSGVLWRENNWADILSKYGELIN